MSEFKGTKGIWIKTTDGEANFYGICTEKNWLMRIQQNGEKSIQEQEANAKLIAAAPELLEALKLVLVHATYFINENHPHYKIAISAIKKATE